MSYEYKEKYQILDNVVPLTKRDKVVIRIMEKNPFKTGFYESQKLTASQSVC